ncbi:hypothetical protein F4803DRAFT_565457 [Xylaria telfairii]|nr:hypothetical protein F4803DRAFT_565457 [Xylaria telfairii]
MSESIRVAICGGSLAGASLLRALLKFSHLDMHIFESAKEFKEAGMAIGITRNAQAALDLMEPSAGELLERARAVPMPGVRFMIGQGEGQGEVFSEVDGAADEGKRLTSIVHRAEYLRELLADVSQERMHASKKLETADRNSDGSVTLPFIDGTTYQCDILIGADGIRSTVRKLILGEDDPAVSPGNTGVLVDLGDAPEYSWAGDNTYMLHNLLSDDQLVQVVIVSSDKVEETESSERWSRTVTADEIKTLFRGWTPHLTQAIDELLSGPMCITGDAAHAMTPWQASGGGTSIEDSLILSTLLGRARSATEAQTALKVYDQVHRPRTQRIVDSSRETGYIMLGKGEKTAVEWKRSGDFFRRWDFILNIDMEKHRDEAIARLKAELGGEV